MPAQGLENAIELRLQDDFSKPVHLVVDQQIGPVDYLRIAYVRVDYPLHFREIVTTKGVPLIRQCFWNYHSSVWDIQPVDSQRRKRFIRPWGRCCPEPIMLAPWMSEYLIEVVYYRPGLPERVASLSHYLEGHRYVPREIFLRYTYLLLPRGKVLPEFE